VKSAVRAIRAFLAAPFGAVGCAAIAMAVLTLGVATGAFAIAARIERRAKR
jgi:hypothetical protein